MLRQEFFNIVQVLLTIVHTKSMVSYGQIKLTIFENSYPRLLSFHFKRNYIICYTENLRKHLLRLIFLESLIWEARRRDAHFYYIWRLISVLSNYWSPIKNTKRRRVRLDRNVAKCSRPTTNVIGQLHECKKVCPCTKALPQSGIRAWIKQGRKKRKKRGRGQEADGKKGSPTKHKHIWGTKTRPTYPSTPKVNKSGEERLTSPSHRMRPLAPKGTRIGNLWVSGWTTLNLLKDPL